MIRTMIFFCTISLAWPVVAQEQQPVSTSDAKAALKIDVEQYRLSNGLTVLLNRDDRLPVVAVEIRYLVGAANERPGRSGFAHLFEHLMFQGSANFNDEYFKPLTPIGAAVNGTTNNDRTNYYERVPKEYLELALWLESDRMENLLPALSLKKLNNQREVVKNERRQSYEDRPYGTVWLRLFHNLFPKGHPYDHTTIGSHEDLTAASLDDVKAFFKQYYVPANAVVTIVGDFEPTQAKALVKKYFGHMPAGQRAAKPQAKPVVLAADVHVTEEDEVKLPRVHYAWHSPALYAKGDAALDILSTVLADGKSSRLYKPLVYDQKVAKDVTAFQVSLGLSGFYVIQATAAPGKTLETLVTALNKAIDDALKTPPTNTEMQRALNGWKKSFYGRVESVLTRAQLLSNYYHLAGTANFLTNDLNRYMKLTANDVSTAAKTWLSRHKVRVDIVPKKETAKATQGGAK
ncbi:MAG: pitrilysin family protein [Myxococcota bacterium]|nr:pitrilysin family protein [Myxococcota bacterium]